MGRRVIESQPNLTKHASCRMSERSIKEWQIEQVLSYGRKSYNRKAVIYAVGRKEIQVMVASSNHALVSMFFVPQRTEPLSLPIATMT